MGNDNDERFTNFRGKIPIDVSHRRANERQIPNGETPRFNPRNQRADKHFEGKIQRARRRWLHGSTPLMALIESVCRKCHHTSHTRMFHCERCGSAQTTITLSAEIYRVKSEEKRKEDSVKSLNAPILKKDNQDK